MKRFLMLLFLLFAACSHDPDFLLSDEEPFARASFPSETVFSGSITSPDQSLLYSDEEGESAIISGVHGLSGNYRRAYLTYFTDYTGHLEEKRLLDKKLTTYLSGYGLTLTATIGEAEVVINGKMLSLNSAPATLVTNTEGLLYNFDLEYSVESISGEVLIEASEWSEYLLVQDTNTYESNDVYPYLVQQAAKSLSELIYYGELSDGHSRTSFQILGEDD